MQHFVLFSYFFILILELGHVGEVIIPSNPILKDEKQISP